MVNDKNLIMGEINSINEEHQLNITDDDKILYHGLRLLSNINHPFNKLPQVINQPYHQKSTTTVQLINRNCY